MRKGANVRDAIQRSEEPLKELGPGISTYHSLLVVLIFVFLVLSLLHIPVLRTYAEGGFYNDSGYWLPTTTIGNLGFA